MLYEVITVRVIEIGLRVEPIALPHQAPEPLVAHDHRIEHAVALVSELVLPQHTDAGVLV